ncbi:MAG: helix-turn-helix transcriptional regulator [Moraxellaceae bacterium]|nr:helix-turn-helix transcriptional regulator [Moraxellaceae bacterium]
MSNALNEKIRTLREMKHWSQDKMAEQVNMSKNGYAKMERGESRLTVETLDKVAQAFNMDMVELINLTDKGMVCLFSDNSQGTQFGNFYQGSENLINENEKLKLELKYKDELLSQKDNELIALKKLLAVYEKETP